MNLELCQYQRLKNIVRINIYLHCQVFAECDFSALVTDSITNELLHYAEKHKTCVSMGFNPSLAAIIIKFFRCIYI